MLKPDLSKLKENDKDEWALAFDWLWGPAVNIARNTIFGCLNENSEEDAEDVAIESITLLLRKIREKEIKVDECETVDELKFILICIVRGKALDLCDKLHAGKRDIWKTDSFEAMQENGKIFKGPTKEDSPLKNLERAEIWKAIQETLRQLKPRDRELWLDYFMKPLEIEKIAEKHGITKNNVSVRLNRIYKKMRPLLGPYYEKMRKKTCKERR